MKEILPGVFEAVVGVWDDRPHWLRISRRVFQSVLYIIEHCPWLPKQASVFRIYRVEFCLFLKVLKGNLLINPFPCQQYCASENSILFIDFNDIPNVDFQEDVEFGFVPKRWRHCKWIVSNGLDESFAFGFIRLIGAVVLPVAPARHVDARPVAAGELVLCAACQFEPGCVGGCKRARLGVVVDCPLVRADQQGANFCIAGCKKLFV